MAMKKAEMEAHQARYQKRLTEARIAEEEARYYDAIASAVSAWTHIDGMMQYERSYGKKELVNIEAIEIVLKHAPLLFDSRSLDALESLLKESRRIEKGTAANMETRLTRARALMWDARRMWDHLEQNPESRQDELRQVLGTRRDRWTSLASTWETMGLVKSSQDNGTCRLSIVTRMTDVVSGKCSSCGHVIAASKATLLGELHCPECRNTSFFVLLNGNGQA